MTPTPRMGRTWLVAAVLTLSAALAFHAAVLRHQVIHLGGPLIAITDRLTGRVETCRVRLDGATCMKVQHVETLEERANRLAREADSSGKQP
jgi:hypothetical protein